MSDAAAKPKGRSKVLILVVAVMVLGGAGGGFYFWKQSKATAAEHPQPEPEHEDAGSVVSLEPFLVNLADSEASRFLRANIRLVVAGEDVAKELEHSDVHKAKLRSAILELLTTQQSAALVTPEGKAALKQVIAERASEVLKAKVTDVLFTDFVVQF